MTPRYTPFSSSAAMERLRLCLTIFIFYELGNSMIEQLTQRQPPPRLRFGPSFMRQWTVFSRNLQLFYIADVDVLYSIPSPSHRAFVVLVDNCDFNGFNLCSRLIMTNQRLLVFVPG